MIMTLVTGKAFPWVAGGTAVLLAGLLALSMWLHHRNGVLNERVGQLDAANAQFATVIRQQAAENAHLHAELDRRDAVVTQAIRARQAAERYARDEIERLRHDLQNDECATAEHPAAVAHSLRQNTASGDQD